MIEIDGTFGEGGGQILRTSLALSLLTKQPLCITGIRGKRPRPGLRHQHLAAVRAAAEIGQAEVEGDALGSTQLTFRPAAIQPGDYCFDIGTAGSTSLVFQTVFPALALQTTPSQVTLRGGTSNPHAPPFEFLSAAFLPLVRQIGFRVDATLCRAGFHPAGGGELQVRFEPPAALTDWQLQARGPQRKLSATAQVANLPLSIAERECRWLARVSQWPRKAFLAEAIAADGPGNVVMIRAEFADVCELFTAFGRQGVPAERVAREAWSEAQAYLRNTAPVGPHLADQLLLPLSLAAHFAGCQGRFRATALTDHAETHRALIQRFLNVTIRAQPLGQHDYQFDVEHDSSVPA